MSIKNPSAYEYPTADEQCWFEVSIEKWRYGHGQLSLRDFKQVNVNELPQDLFDDLKNWIAGRKP